MARPTTLPEPGRARRLRMPRLSERKLRSGLRVVAVRKPSVPKVEIQLRIPFGTPTRARAAELLLAATFAAGTARRSATDIAQELQRCGATLDASASADFFSVSGSALKPYLADVLALLGELLTEADFPRDEVELARGRAVQELHIVRSQPQFVALEALRRRLYGRHPYAIVRPDPGAVERVRRASIRELHADRVRPRGAVLVLVGDVQPARALDLAEDALRSWRGRNPAEELPEPGEIAPGALRIVDRPGAVQTNIRLAGPAVGPAHPDAPALSVANAIFGGSFMSRFVQNIREDKGYTYSPHSGVQHMRRSSTFEVAADVGMEVTAAALTETRYELSRMAATTVDPDELISAQRFLVGSLAVQIQSQRGLAGRLAGLFAHDLGLAYLRELPRHILATTADEVQAVSAAYLAPERLTGVLVGDAEEIGDTVAAVAPVDAAPARAS